MGNAPPLSAWTSRVHVRASMKDKFDAPEFHRNWIAPVGLGMKAGTRSVNAIKMLPLWNWRAVMTMSP